MGRRLVVLTLLLTSPVFAHVVPRSSHDRTITVTLKEDRLDIEYRLEVDELTVALEDMAPFRDEVPYAKYRQKPLEYYREFARIYAPILADNLRVTVDGKAVAVTPTTFEPTLRDKNDKPLDHLRCDFHFTCSLPAGSDVITFREENYLLQSGDVRLFLVNGTHLNVTEYDGPDATLIVKPAEQRTLDDDRRLREFRVALSASQPPAPIAPPAPTEPPRRADNDLLHLARSDWGLGWILLAAFWFGAAHALTPGHGKTLVAAYLVGQRGTLAHALFLGLITTITHTGIVLTIALVLRYVPTAQPLLHRGLGLFMGLTIVCMGFYLLLQRLANRADHVHLPGMDHHHGPVAKDVTWWQLLILGVSGGIVPCYDAVALLFFMIGTDKQHLALPVLVVFSLGLASVLVALGVLVVKVRSFAGSKWGEGRWTRTLSLLSAACIIAMGFWLCRMALEEPSGR